MPGTPFGSPKRVLPAGDGPIFQAVAATAWLSAFSHGFSRQNLPSRARHEKQAVAAVACMFPKRLFVNFTKGFFGEFGARCKRSYRCARSPKGWRA